VEEIYEVGPRRLGVRWSRSGLSAQLRALVGESPAAGAAPWNLSVVVGEAKGTTRSKHQLHVQGRFSLAFADDGRLLRSMLRMLGVLGSVAPPGSLTVNAVLVLRPDGSGVVVDHRLVELLQRIEPQLRHGGCRVLYTPWVVLDPAGAAALLPDSIALLGVETNELARRWPSGAADDDLRSGALGIDSFAYLAPRDATSRAAVVAGLTPTVMRADQTTSTEDVELLAQLDVRAIGITDGDRSRLRSLLLGE
jgi:hypothetical protein